VSRVAEVNGNLNSKFRSVSRRAEIPYFLYPLLRFIGTVSLPGIPAVYYPGVVVPKRLILNATVEENPTLEDPEEIERIIAGLIRFKALGAMIATGVPRSPDGTCEFMFSSVEGER